MQISEKDLDSECLELIIYVVTLFISQHNDDKIRTINLIG